MGGARAPTTSSWAARTGLSGTTTPVPTASTVKLALNATQITIDGLAFDPIAANDTVTFNDSAVGTVTAATFNSLTVTFSKAPIDVGSLTAIVQSDGVSSGAAVPVATMTPVLTSSTANLAASHPRSRSRAWASIRPPPMTRSRSTTGPSAR